MRRLIALGIALALAAWAQSLAGQRAYPLDAVILWTAAAIALYLGVLRPLSVTTTEATTSSLDAHPEIRPGYRRRQTTGLVLLALGTGLGFEATAQFFQLQFVPLATGLWLAAIALIVAGFWLLDTSQGTPVTRPRLDAGVALNGRNPPRWEMVGLGLVLLVAFFFRIHNLHNAQSGLYLDEADNCLEAMRLFTLPNYQPFTPVSNGHPTLFLYGLGGAFQAVGASVDTMRIFIAFIGTLTVAAFYPLARLMFTRWVALALAFLLAVSHWHVGFSRIGFEGILTPLVAILSVYWSLRALRSGRCLHYAWAGLSLGLCVHTYLPSRLLPLLALALFGMSWFRNRAVWRPAWSGVAVVLIVMLIVVSPLAAHFWNYPADFFNRANQAAVTLDIERSRSWQPLYENIRKTLVMFNWQGDPRPRHNLPNQPMLDWVSGLWFGLGSICLLAGWRRWRQSLLLIWLALMLLPGVLSLADPNPHSLRTIGATPAVFLVIGLGLENARRVWDGAFRSTSYRVVLWGLALSLVLAAWLNFDFHYNLRPADRSIWYDFDPAQTVAAIAVKEYAASNLVYVSPALTNHPSIRFIAAGWAYRTLNLNEDMPIRNNPDRDIVYILEPSHTSLLRQLGSYYPNGQQEIRRDPYGLPMFAVFRAPAGDIRATLGLAGRFFPGLEGDDNPVDLPPSALNYEWATDAPLPAPFRAEWRGSLLAPSFGRYQLYLESTGEASLSLDNQVLLPAGVGRREVSLELPGGFHSVAVSLTQPAPSGGLSLGWITPSGQQEVIPGGALLTIPASDNGLLGRYYTNNSWKGTPEVVRIDTLPGAWNYVPAPFSIEWQGMLYTPRSGAYVVGTNSDDGSFLWIDGTLVVDNGGHHADRYVENKVVITEGLRDLRIRYFQDDGGRKFELWWTPPGGQKEMVPSAYLFPPNRPPSEQQRAQLAQGPRNSPPAAASAGLDRLTLQSAALYGGPETMGESRSVAVDKAGAMYVADTAAQRILRLDARGALTRSWGRPGQGDGEFQEPFAVVVDSQGFVLVLDSVRADIQRFTSDGRFLARIPINPPAYRPRGLSLDADDNLIIADTGGNRVIKMAPSGQPIATYSFSSAGQFSQPVSAVFDHFGNLWVAEPEAGRIQSVDPHGNNLATVQIQRGGTFNGPHLAIAHGAIFATDPESAQVLVLAPDGAILRRWGGPGTEPGEMLLPIGIAVDAQGALYVSEVGNHRIQKITVTR